MMETTQGSHISYQCKAHHTEDLLLDLYISLVLPRMVEEKMLKLLRMNKISKWFSGIGQEAISVGVTKALHKNEYILPMHRNLGVFTSRHIPLERLFLQWQGKEGGFTQGRDRSFHFGSNEHHIVGMISHLGPQLSVGSGIALGCLIKNEKKVTVAFTGEGGTSEGEFHEALNVAAVWQLPIIFIIENNGYGLSTPTSEQYFCKDLVDRGIGYGMEARKIDGNNILEVYDTIRELARDLRENPRPVLIECVTFRMRGHEEASGTKYVPKELMKQWAQKDPIQNFENFLLEESILDQTIIQNLQKEITQRIDTSLEIAYNTPVPTANLEKEIHEIYAPVFPPMTTSFLSNGNVNSTSNKRYIEAISDGLRQAMEQNSDLVLMGQDIADYGGVFKITKDFTDWFGKDRVRNTPLCESAIVGICLGLSIKGCKSMVEMQFADFVSCGFNQIINNLSKAHYRWGQNADVVVRMPAGGSVGAGPFHSQTNEAWFFHSPGLKIVYPSNPYDAKGLLLAAFEDPNPVMYYEHKALYRRPDIEQVIPDEPYTIEIGKANLIATGEDISVITYGLGVYWTKKALEDFPHISMDVLDLRTLLPLDQEAIFDSVKKTGKVIVLQEASLTGGIGGEIAALISQHCFEYLDAPVVRCASLDTPVPFAKTLEQQYLPEERFRKALVDLWEY